MDQFPLPDSSTVLLWWPEGWGFGEDGALDGKKGAKSRVDREGGQAQDRKMDRGGQGASGVETSVG